MSNKQVKNPFESSENMKEWFEQDEKYQAHKMEVRKSISNNNNMTKKTSNRFLAPILIGFGALAALVLVLTSVGLPGVNQGSMLTQVVAAEEERQTQNEGKMLHQVVSMSYDKESSREYANLMNEKYEEWAKENDPFYEQYASESSYVVEDEMLDEYMDITISESYIYGDDTLNLAKNSAGEVVFADMQKDGESYFYDSMMRSEEFMQDPMDNFMSEGFFCMPDGELMMSTIPENIDEMKAMSGSVEEEEGFGEIMNALYNPNSGITNSELFDILRTNTSIVEELGTKKVNGKKVIEFKINDPYSALGSEMEGFFGFEYPDTVVSFDAQSFDLYQMINRDVVDGVEYVLNTSTYSANEYLEYDESVFDATKYGLEANNFDFGFAGAECMYNGETLPQEVYDVFSEGFVEMAELDNEMFELCPEGSECDVFDPDKGIESEMFYQEKLREITDKQNIKYLELLNAGVISQEVYDAAVQSEAGIFGPGPMMGFMPPEANEEEKAMILSLLGLPSEYNGYEARVSSYNAFESNLNYDINYGNVRGDGTGDFGLNFSLAPSTMINNPPAEFARTEEDRCYDYVAFNDIVELNNGFDRIDRFEPDTYAYEQITDLTNVKQQVLDECSAVKTFFHEGYKNANYILDMAGVNPASVVIDDIEHYVFIDFYGFDVNTADAIVNQLAI